MPHHRKIRTRVSVGRRFGPHAVRGTAQRRTSRHHPGIAPGCNFNLSVWELQEPTGSPGSPPPRSTRPGSKLQWLPDSYFFTNKTEADELLGPGHGVTTRIPIISRSELREMNSAARRRPAYRYGTHTLKRDPQRSPRSPTTSALARSTPPDSATTKPLAELYYHKQRPDRHRHRGNGPGPAARSAHN